MSKRRYIITERGKKAMKENAKMLNTNPDILAKRSKAASMRWQNPEELQKQRDRAKQAWAKRRAKRKNGNGEKN